MSSALNVFFSKELTCLPSIFDRYVGKYYNNALGNAISWTFFIWLIVHFVFYKFTNVLLKQMKYPEYQRTRIIVTLWNFSFCSASLMYCFATLSRNNIDVFNFHDKFLANDINVIPARYLFGFTVLSTYYTHNAFWEGTIQSGSIFYTLEQLSFALLASVIYVNGCVELLFVLIYVNNITQCILELSRTFAFQLHNRVVMNAISIVYFVLHAAACLSMYTVIMPPFILLPVIKRMLFNATQANVTLNIALWTWLAFNVYNSVISKILQHFAFHHVDRNFAVCEKSLIDCCIFPPRTDAAFTVYNLRKHIENRTHTVGSQKEKPKVALFQTIKCMINLRRRLKQRRLSNNNTYIIKDILNDIVDNAMDIGEGMEQSGMEQNIEHFAK